MVATQTTTITYMLFIANTDDNIYKAWKTFSNSRELLLMYFKDTKQSREKCD